jgi:hypothetical protein
MSAGDAGLPYSHHLQTTVSRDTFPAPERIAGARNTVKERAEFRATHTRSLPGDPPRTLRSFELTPEDEADDCRAFTHYLEKHVHCASLIPVCARVPRTCAFRCDTCEHALTTLGLPVRVWSDCILRIHFALCARACTSHASYSNKPLQPPPCLPFPRPL